MYSYTFLTTIYYYLFQEFKLTNFLINIYILHVGTIVDGLNNKANSVGSKQVHYQQNPHLHGADNPTYLKGKGDGLVNTISVVVFTTASLLLFRGHWKIAHGSK